MNLVLDLQVSVAEPSLVPDDAAFESWVRAAAIAARAKAEETIELTVRVVDEDEGTDLNEAYRGKVGPTNVLSFPFDAPVELPTRLLGDIVICAPVVVAEATAQGKPEVAHWAHLVVHGVLHLCGFDHQNEADALEMEAMEREMLASLGFPDPYLDRHQPA